MLIYDSLSGKKQLLKKARKPLRLFVCGPTVYDDSHLGHARTQIAFDIIVRYLRHQGWKLRYLQNITDVDDKIIARAKEYGVNPLGLAKKFEKSYREDLKALRVTQIDTFARASNFIPQIVKQIQTLIKKEYAYVIEEQGIYFDIKKFKDYGKLARRTVRQAEDGVSRIDEADKKRNKGDFCLWKFVKTQMNAESASWRNADKRGKKTHNLCPFGTSPAGRQLMSLRDISRRETTYVPSGHLPQGDNLQLVDGEPAWASPFGPGRPGWHIEDTAITEHFFGPQYDIHGGGLDLKFPHHEAEIAQQEAASGKKPFVNIWMHAGLLRVEGKKMSKGLGNFITIKQFLEKDEAEILRWIVLSHHYRSPASYSEELSKNAKESLKTLRELLLKLAFIMRFNLQKEVEPRKKVFRKETIEKAERAFHAAMEDDFNTPVALAALFTLVRDLNKEMWSLSRKDAKTAALFMSKTLNMLGMPIKPRKTPKHIEKLAEHRELSRVNKQFIRADALRKKIEGLGYTIEDTPLGPMVLKMTNS
ncbi:MAG: cysteine--tRNA ligase [Nanoarchaeota archaeon]|nr:cysteine--tRNA ligase [Nanoarchaeota archaeon]